MFILLFIIVWFIWMEMDVLKKINVYRLCHPLLYDFSKHKHTGSHVINSKRIIICGLACNIASYLERTKELIHNITYPFEDYRIVIFENNSRDNSSQLLNEWQKVNEKVHILQGESDHNFNSLYEFGTLSKERMSRMAYYRNIYLDFIQRHYNDWDYMLVMDMDLDAAMPLEGFWSNFARDDWDVIACNGRMSIPGSMGFFTGAYDGLAYLSETDNSANDFRGLDLFSNFLDMNKEILNAKDFIPVRSAFNGAALYKLSIIAESRYTGERCEHISFHDQLKIKNGAKIFINPKWLLYCRHQGPTGMSKLVKDLFV